MKVLVTGAAGFIGFHTSLALLSAGHKVIGIDNLNDYYDPDLKQARLDQLNRFETFAFNRLDISDDARLRALTENQQPDRIIHLAAQAGVRYSLENPMAYARSNLIGHLSVLEAARHTPSVKHVVYASSSSVYGEREEAVFHEADDVNTPVSLYAATKRADELMSLTYANLYGLSLTGLRFFTVFGPWGRPDMAYWLFTDAIMNGRPIKVFNEGRMERDFTYIDDVVNCLMRINTDAPSSGHHEIYNIGGSNPQPLSDFITAIEAAIGQKAEKQFLPMQQGDVTRTAADVSKIANDYGYAPETPMAEGVKKFVDWYRDYFRK